MTINVSIPAGNVDKLSTPSGFSWTDHGLNIYRFMNGSGYTTNFNPSSKMIQGGLVHYVDPVNGTDSGDGTSTPRDTLQGLIQQLDSDGVTAATIVLAPGFYDATQGMGREVLGAGFACNLICPNGIAKLEASVTGTWTQTANQTNTYEYTKSTGAPPYSAIDRVMGGVPTLMVARSSVEEVEANPGSYYLSGRTLYVHTGNSREPDEYVRVMLDAAFHAIGGHAFYAENVLFHGGTNALLCNTHVEDAERTFVNCGFGWAKSDGLAVRLDRGNVFSLYRSDAYFNGSDGLNYKRITPEADAHDVIEINCRAWSNGYNSVSQPANNGSTGHEGARIIRVNGLYSDNYNRQVHDIHTCESWMIGCRAGNATNQDNADDSAAFMFGRTQGDATLAWLDGCESLGGVVTDFGVYEGATLRYRNMDEPTVYGGGTVEEY